ncbi:MAG: dTDP-glucose 4,6-dehydratase [Verrucomicrobia bacterium]|nr:dTDP-glucose 4,6-dehydratase [Verrucomicrobiota bacterium]
MNLLVTGGCGFIGSHVLEHAIGQPEVERVVNLDCLAYAGRLENVAAVASHPKYHFEQVDLRDKPAVARVVRDHTITHVLHLAAESHVDRSIEAPGDFIQTNVVGTFNLLEACRAAWTQTPDPRPQTRFVHVSTDEVFGSLGPAGHFTETSPYAPNSPYAASKAASDLLVRSYHQTYGLDTVTTHGSNTYGPRQFPEKLIPLVIIRAAARQPIPVYGDGQNIRDWLHVTDHAQALWQALMRGRAGETYCLGGGNEWPNLRLVEHLCDLVDELAPQLGGNTRRLTTFVPDRPGHDRRYAMDTAKARRELGLQPMHSFESGIRETVRRYLTQQPARGGGSALPEPAACGKARLTPAPLNRKSPQVNRTK